jgi:hypothetical protein
LEVRIQRGLTSVPVQNPVFGEELLTVATKENVPDGTLAAGDKMASAPGGTATAAANKLIRSARNAAGRVSARVSAST